MVEITKAVILITTRTLDYESLSNRLANHLGREKDEFFDSHKEYVFCRRLAIYHLSPASFLHIVAQLIKEAQKTIWT